ncbi:hypothetical protein IJI55_02845 [Candidatus Saccharibacteria bacterium]|nr:hypothetical protein [Candidatus Saccharibacteria bacterium]
MNKRFESGRQNLETSSNKAEKSRWDTLIEFGRSHIFKDRAEKINTPKSTEIEKTKEEILSELRQNVNEAYADDDRVEDIQTRVLRNIGMDVEKIQGRAEVERELNKRLITIDKMEEEIKKGNPEIERLDDVEYEGKNIPVYSLKGLPFAMLNHTVDYRRPDYESGGKGSQTSQQLLEDPSLWVRNQKDVMQDSRYSNDFKPDSMGNVISCSYIDSGNNLRGDIDYGSNATCKYGFSKVEEDGLFGILDQDMHSPNIYDYTKLYGVNVSDLNNLESANEKKEYNEIVIRRYLKDGQPRLPDFMITKDGRIPEDTLRHARYFNIPIVNIDTEAYNKKADEIAVAELETVSEDSSYMEIASVVERLSMTYKYDGINLLNTMGRGRSSRYFEGEAHRLDRRYRTEDMVDKLLKLEKLEYEKRLDFIMDEIKQAAEDCKKATVEGRKYSFSSDNLSSLDVTVFDVERGLESNETKTDSINMYSPKETPVYNEIQIRMMPKNTTRLIKTDIVDGEQYRNRGNEDLDDEDADIYKTILPQIQDYLAARQKNSALMVEKHE